MRTARSTASRLQTPPRERSSSVAGFTLLELLIATVIFSVLATALARALWSGIHLERRIAETENSEAALRSDLDLLTRHLSSLLPTERPLTGGEDHLKFVSRVLDWADTSEPKWQTAQVEVYSLGTSDCKVVFRPWPDLAADSTVVDLETKVSFLYLSSPRRPLDWLSEWDEDSPPIGVAIHAKIRPSSGRLLEREAFVRFPWSS